VAAARESKTGSRSEFLRVGLLRRHGAAELDWDEVGLLIAAADQVEDGVGDNLHDLEGSDLT
jgi:hypothetical protein